MEQVRSRAALEPEVRLGFPSRALWLGIGGVLAAPFFASGHGAQFVLGKVTPLEGGGVRLELTADYGENPLIENAEQAREELVALMRWRDAGTTAEGAFEALPEARFEERTQLDPTIPLPTSEDQMRAEHHLLTGIWEWVPESPQVQLELTKGTPLDVLLWTDHAPADEAPMKWAILIAGDRSPLILLKPRQGLSHWGWWIALGGLGMVVLVSRFWVATRSA